MYLLGARAEPPIFLAVRLSPTRIGVERVDVRDGAASTREQFRTRLDPGEKVARVGGYSDTVCVFVVGYRHHSHGYTRGLLFTAARPGKWERTDLGEIGTADQIWDGRSTLLILGPGLAERVLSVAHFRIEFHPSDSIAERSAFVPGWGEAEQRAEKFLANRGVPPPMRYESSSILDDSGFWPPPTGRLADVSADGASFVASHGGPGGNVVTVYSGPAFGTHLDLPIEQPIWYRFGPGVIAVETYSNAAATLEICTVYDVRTGKRMAQIPCECMG